RDKTLAAVATGPAKLAIRLRCPHTGKKSSAGNTNSIKAVKSHCRSPEQLRRFDTKRALASAGQKIPQRVPQASESNGDHRIASARLRNGRSQKTGRICLQERDQCARRTSLLQVVLCASRSTVQIQRRGESSMREYPISASVPILPG